MRVLFMGTPDFAVPCLEKILTGGYEVVGVVTQPDRTKGRKQVPTPPPVKVAAEKHGLLVLQPEKLRDPDAIRQVIELEPDLIVTAAYGQILPREVLDAPLHGCINVHASLLPKYRGGAPIHKAIIEGEKESGVTIMYMVPKLDAGDMLTRTVIPIDEWDTVGTLHDKLSAAGAQLLGETIPLLLQGKITPQPQDEAVATYAPNLTREDERIDWGRPAIQIYNQIRGLNPWPVAHTYWQGEVLKVWRAEPPTTIAISAVGSTSLPGTVLAVSEQGIEVAAGEGTVLLTEIQPAGKRQMSVAEFLRGAGQNLAVGTRLGEQQLGDQQ